MSIQRLGFTFKYCLVYSKKKKKKHKQKIKRQYGVSWEQYALPAWILSVMMQSSGQKSIDTSKQSRHNKWL